MGNIQLSKGEDLQRDPVIWLGHGWTYETPQIDTFFWNFEHWIDSIWSPVFL